MAIAGCLRQSCSENRLRVGPARPWSRCCTAPFGCSNLRQCGHRALQQCAATLAGRCSTGRTTHSATAIQRGLLDPRSTPIADRPPAAFPPRRSRRTPLSRICVNGPWMVVELPQSGHRKSFACESFTVRPMARCQCCTLPRLPQACGSALPTSAATDYKS